MPHYLLTRCIWYLSACYIIFTSCNNKEKWIPQYNEFSNQWKQQIEAGQAFTDVYMDATGNAWASSEDGIICYRPSGSITWTKEILPVSNAHIKDIGGYGNEVWATGEDGLILHKKKGQSWTQDTSITIKAHLNYIYTYGQDLWVLGTMGTILHKSGNRPWVQETCSEKNANLKQMAGQPGNWYIVGHSGVILHNTDSSWTNEPCPVENAALNHVLVLENEVWITGDNGVLLRKTGDQSWIKEKAPLDKTAYSGIYGWNDQVWIAGTDGIIMYKNGNQPWVKEVEMSHMKELFFISMYGKDRDMWVTGSRGVIMHKKGTGKWNQEEVKGYGGPLFDIAGNGNEMITVGLIETIATRKGDGPWVKEKTMSTSLTFSGIFAQNDEIWVSCTDGSIMYKKGNSEWQHQPTGVKDFIVRGGYRYGNDVWLIGSHGAVLHKSGNGDWLNKTTFLGNLFNIQLTDLYAQQDEIWVVGSHGTILHKNSGDLKFVKDYAGLSSQNFSGIYARGNELWVSGGPILLLHKKMDDFNWEEEEIDISSLRNLPDLHIDAIAGHGQDIWVAGNPGVLLHKKGKGDWERESIDAPRLHFYRMFADGKNVCAIGNLDQSGMIVSKTADNNFRTEKIEGFNLLDAIPYNGLFVLTQKGFLYREDVNRNLLQVHRLKELHTVTGAAVANGKLYCISNNVIGSISKGELLVPTVSQIKYHVVDIKKPDSLEIQVTINAPPQSTAGLQTMTVWLDAIPMPEGQTSQDDYTIIHGSYASIDSSPSSRTLAIRFEIKKNFRIIPSNENANKLQVRMHLNSESENIDEHFVLKDDKGHPYLEIGDDSLAKYGVRIALVFISIALICCIAWFKPLWLFTLYRPQLLKEIVAVHPLLSRTAYLLNSLIPLQKLIYSSRMMDDWTQACKEELFRRFEQNITVQYRKVYFPLPIEIETNTGSEPMDAPDETLIDKLFRTKRTIVQIIGTGGAGKTTLAIAIARWLIQMARKQSSGMVRIPVFVDSDTDNLLSSITQQLKSWLQHKHLPESFVKMLLKKQRLVVIVDALSEKTIPTQDHFKNIHSTVPVNALIITSRQPLQLLAKESTYLHVNSLNSEDLLYFISSYLAYKKHPLLNAQDHLAFAEKIVELVENNSHTILITPILVKLIIDNGLANADSCGSAEELIHSIPDHIPEVFYQFLTRVNPTNTEAPNYLDHYQMIEVVGIMAKLALKKNRIPHAFKESDLKLELAAFPQLNADQCIQRCIDNGIITSSRPFNTNYLQFTMDTLAEYIGAGSLYDEHMNNPEQLDALITMVRQLGDEASGFKMAFEQVMVYKAKLLVS